MKEELHSPEFKMFKEKKRFVPWMLNRTTMLCVALFNMSAFANTVEFSVNPSDEVSRSKGVESYTFQQNNITITERCHCKA